MDLKAKIQEAMKIAMRSQEKDRLAVIRLILAAIKQIEVDKRIQLSDNDTLDVLNKMTKQRKESIAQFAAAKREDLVAKENFELTVIQQFMPEQLEIGKIKELIKESLIKNQASSIKDMAKVMQDLRGVLAGRADLEQVGKLVKESLQSK